MDENEKSFNYYWENVMKFKINYKEENVGFWLNYKTIKLHFQSLKREKPTPEAFTYVKLRVKTYPK